MAKTMMGFKKVDRIPTGIDRHKGRSIYEPLIREVDENGGIYSVDTKDRKRAANLANTLRHAIKKFGANVKVTVRHTSVYVSRPTDVADE